MNSVALKTFLAIAETGSLVNASERLFVSQSTVTSRLQSLEQDIGQPLFNRKKSGVTLTAAGIKFKRYAGAMLDLWHQAKQETSLPAGVSSWCNIGCHHDLWSGTGRTLINNLHQQYPDIALSFVPGHHDQLTQWMSTGVIDAALSYRPFSQQHQTIHKLFTEQLILVAKKPNNPMRSDPHYIYFDAGQDFGRKHAAEYSDAGIAKVSFSSADWALDYLQDQGGSAYLPEHLVRPLLDEKKLFLVEGAPLFTRNAYLVTNDLVSEEWGWLDSLEDLILPKVSFS